MSNAVKINVSADSTAAVSGLNKAKGAVDNFKKTSESSFASIGSKFAGIFAAVAAMSGLKSAADELDRVQKLSIRFGESAEDIQRVGHAAGMAGTNLEDVAKAMQKAGGNALAAAQGNKGLKEAFAGLGIDAASFVDLPINEKLIALSQALQEGGSNAEQLDRVMAILGKSGAEMMPLLAQGPEALKASLDEAAVVAGKTVDRIAAANDKIALALSRVKAGAINAIAGVVEFFEGASVKFFKFVTFIQNLGSGVKEASRLADEYERFVKADAARGASKEGISSDTGNFSEAAAEDKERQEAAQKAEEKLAKLKAENDRKEEDARLKTLSLKQRELELSKAIAKIEAEKISHGKWLDPERAEELRGHLLDLNKELTENQADQKKEADKAAEEEKKRKEKDLKDAEKAAKDKAKAEKDAKKEALQEQIEDANKRLDTLQGSDASFSVDSLRAIGGGLAGVNYGAALSKVDVQKQAVDLQKQTVEQLRSILKQLEKGDRTDLGNGSFAL